MNIKSTLLLVLVVIASAAAIAQPTLTSNFNPTIGSATKLASADTTNVSEGAAGANVTYDFSALQQKGNTVSYTHIAPSATPYANKFSSANLAFQTTSSQGNAGYSYLKTTATTFENVGVATADLQMEYTNSQIALKFPMVYNTSFTDDFSGSATNSQNITTYRKGISTSQADAWGTVKLLQGTFSNVLRVRTEQTVKDSINFMGNDIISETKIITYNFFRDDIKQQIVGISYLIGKDFFGDDYVIKSVLYYPDAVNSVESLNKQNNFSVYPNPAASKVTITSKNDIEATSYTITDILGKTYLSQTINTTTGETDIDVSTLPQGMYIVSLYTANNLVGTQKLSIAK